MREIINTIEDIPAILIHTPWLNLADVSHRREIIIELQTGKLLRQNAEIEIIKHRKLEITNTTTTTAASKNTQRTKRCTDRDRADVLRDKEHPTSACRYPRYPSLPPDMPQRNQNFDNLTLPTAHTHLPTFSRPCSLSPFNFHYYNEW